MDSMWDDDDLNGAPAKPVAEADDAVGEPDPDEQPITGAGSRRKITVKGPSQPSKARVLDSEDEDVPPPRPTRSNPNGEYPTNGRGLRSRSIRDTGSPDSLSAPSIQRTTRSGRSVAPNYAISEEDDDDDGPRQVGRRRAGKPSRNDNFIEDDENDDIDSDAGYGQRSTRSRKPPPPRRPKPKKSPRKRSRNDDEDGDFELTGKSDVDTDEESGSHDFDAPVTSPSPEPPSPHRTRAEAAHSPRGYGLRPARRPINYQIPPPLETDASFANMAADLGGDKPVRPPRPRFGLARAGSQALGAIGGGLLPDGSLPAAPQLNDDSDSDDPNHPSNKAARGGANAANGQGLIGAGGATNDGAAAAGGPANYGKVSKDSLLADTDPLGVNVNVTFDEVGGLDDHISSLKEMVMLPLLYPDIFQQFKITPPRGVLFHGPPGTGKTLVARALASSARNGGREVAFFMRKGADILSKWVGEAERQLRLLFEEAKNCQPSIIFFDEIDGLAPVRSSKQDQIHASIVSTLLALMDGMDGRGQVIVIGATNRPDAVDPALRRPGRFDREFYFPLPNLTGRKKILQILTRGWPGWDGETGEKVLSTVAEMTKGYGGADLRALATEATLNAIQRTYPQIYKSTDRLVVKPETIHVIPRDFMISIKKIVASSARSSASAAAALPPHLAPLLQSSLDQARTALDRQLPKTKQRNALEEAEWEDDPGDDGGFQREMQLQALETQRIYRPRLLLHGPPGMGQAMIGAAALHGLEGVHIQSLDLGTLFGDSARSAEAALVQLFVEAKRRKPSVIYIPSLLGWSSALSDAARNTMGELLDSLPSTDPILLLGVLQGDPSELSPEVRDWFGFSPESVVAMRQPTQQQRLQFFNEVLEDVKRPPNMFPDAIPRRKRILPKLPIAPPPPPRQPTQAELAAQNEKDRLTRVTLIARLAPILTEIKKRYRRSTRTIEEAKEAAALLDGYNRNTPGIIIPPEFQITTQPEASAPVAGTSLAPGDVEMVDAQATAAAINPEPAPLTNGATPAATLVTEPPHQAATILSAPVPYPDPSVPLASAVPPTDATLAPPVASSTPTNGTPKVFAPTEVYKIDVDEMQFKLHSQNNGYLTPGEVLNDLAKIVRNTRIPPCNVDHVLKAHQMHAEFESIIWDPQFLADCQKMAERHRAKMADKKKQEAAEQSAARKSKSASRANSAAASPRLAGGSQPLPGTAPPLAVDTLASSPPADRGLKRPRESSATALPEGSNGSQPKRAKLGGSNPSSPLATDSAPLPVDEPMPMYPDFVLDERDWQNLRSVLEHVTAPLTVEQLEELRAILLDLVWKHRAEWDRSILVRNMSNAVQSYLSRPDVEKLQ
ncbi:AAA-domain-containing protein [Clavulina sp. PMI_390]|nr:AAA-domain-containing protein [Clavulina sp. PMI_390]